MRKLQLLSIFTFLLALQSFAQQTNVKGRLFEDVSGDAIPNAKISIDGTEIKVLTNNSGVFNFEGLNLPLGEQILLISKEDYESKKYPIVINEGQTLDLGDLFLNYDITKENYQISTISLADNELNGDDVSSSNISGLLASSQDTYLRAAAFDFSAAFFNPRGFDNASGKVLINGIEMNEQYDGRPSWGTWGGLNDVQRNRVFVRNTKASDYNFGDIGGTTNIIMRASKMRKGGRVSYASSNRSYQGRVMGSYNSGALNGGWSYSVLMSRRFGEEGFKEGTSYDANSFFLAVEKQLNDKHSLNFSSFYSPNHRGTSTAITQEVIDLRGNEYNPNWGYHNGEKRNTRENRNEQPVFMLNHFWDLSDKLSINTNVAYQTGYSSRIRLENGGTKLYTNPNTGEQTYLGGARNPSPIYYQNLPSYYLQDFTPSASDYQNAYDAREAFVNDGQFDWSEAYLANKNFGGNSVYMLKSDRIEDDQLTFNSIINAELSENITLNGRLNYRNLHSENFAQVEDLLGGQQFLDVDFFAEESETVSGVARDLAQSDLNNPNRLVQEGDRFEYNYDIDAEVYDAFTQLQFKYRAIDFHVGAKFGKTTYQRTGNFRNGFYTLLDEETGEIIEDNSFGPGEELDFTTYGLKAGAVYKITGRHLIDFNAAYQQNAPTIRNSYSNARQTHEIVDGLTEVKSQALDLSYIFKSPLFNARVTGFYAGFQDETNVGFYFTQDLTNHSLEQAPQTDFSAFVQEVMTGMDRRHYGMEFGVEAQVHSTLKLKAAGSFGNYVYTNNPDLYLTSQNFPGQQLRFGDGKTDMKDLHVPGGPERVFQLGFEYRDPDYWNLGVTVNHFSNSYISPSGILRSDNFALDHAGLPYTLYNESIARDLIKQEKFDDYMLVNLTAGKSWRIDDYFLGFFAVVNNVLDEVYKTGGFEQSRTSNYISRLEDMSRPNGALFGNRYFMGYGTTYYLNVYLRF
ncbi:Carboxypeptidase regulatory-like domain-containing protein [Psychroflexus salarius]|uniref:Carboxypeptidase regulatory-like domain-containing protein n=1 Tax=Psychroflexus salarius TaxID=1155689 RepID=A0A1M4VLD4_9FLAO|nr:TonB-dependent receptor [Psychroflexus salarius]SHE69896.1 Carboxypeptidase regulatory-like domain-containing protein [Psychroflexus salarius]